MSNILFLSVIVCAFITLSILISGVILMGKGGKLNQKYGNILMRLRVGMQFITIILLAVAFYLYTSDK